MTAFLLPIQRNLDLSLFLFPSNRTCGHYVEFGQLAFSLHV